jgi:hypothetical protein
VRGGEEPVGEVLIDEVVPQEAFAAKDRVVEDGGEQS